MVVLNRNRCHFRAILKTKENAGLGPNDGFT